MRDADVEPTAFSEYVTIDVPGSGVPAGLKFSSNDGFAPTEPPADRAFDIGAVGLCIDEDPYDHGALLDLEFAPIDPGEAVTFITFYGAAGSEADALAALNADHVTLRTGVDQERRLSGHPERGLCRAPLRT